MKCRHMGGRHFRSLDIVVSVLPLLILLFIYDKDKLLLYLVAMSLKQPMPTAQTRHLGFHLMGAGEWAVLRTLFFQDFL